MWHISLDSVHPCVPQVNRIRLDEADLPRSGSFARGARHRPEHGDHPPWGSPRVADRAIARLSAPPRAGATAGLSAALRASPGRRGHRALVGHVSTGRAGSGSCPRTPRQSQSLRVRARCGAPVPPRAWTGRGSSVCRPAGCLVAPPEDRDRQLRPVELGHRSRQVEPGCLRHGRRRISLSSGAPGPATGHSALRRTAEDPGRKQRTSLGVEIEQ